MNYRDHVWANGALVCNCGARRKPGASASAPPGWPTVPSEPVCNPSAPVHISITVGPAATDPRSRIIVNGVDLTRHVRGFKVTAGVGATTDAWLDLVGVDADIEADVEPSRIQTLTPDQDAVREGSREQRDIERGARSYPRKGEVQLAVSLGEVKP